MLNKLVILEDTKTSQMLTLLSKNDFKGALKIAKTFKIGFSKDEISTIKRAWEMISGNENFYTQLGFKKDIEVGNAVKILKNKYKI